MTKKKKTKKIGRPAKKTVAKKRKAKKPAKSVKKTTRKKTSGAKKNTRTAKKTVQKKNPVKKIRNKKNASQRLKKINEPLSFGLLENEINQLIDDHQELNEYKLKKTVINELTQKLPDNEAIVTSRKPNANNLIIQNIRNRHEHSPYVLNLAEMMEQKKQRQARKEIVLSRYNRNIGHNYEKDIINGQENFQLSKEEIREQFNNDKKIELHIQWRQIFIYCLLCLIIVLPIKGFSYYKELEQNKENAISASQQAMESLKTAGQAIADNDQEQARQNFEQAELNFELAQEQINSVNSTVNSLIKITPKAGKYLTDAQRLAEIGIAVSKIGEQASEISQIFEEKNNAEQLHLTEKIQLLQTSSGELLPQVQDVIANLQKIDPQILPEEYQDSFTEIKGQLTDIEKGLEELYNFSFYIQDILGHEYKRRYLFVFQNNTELRATGGFLGSMALVEIRNGEIINIEMPGGGTYDYQGSLIHNVQSPTPLQLINARWELQDANWFFDFPDSAKKIQWFYENSGGPSVDGVIAVNASLIEKLLTTTEPIYLAEYNKKINSENFIEETQKSVELEYDKQENKPKQFLADLTPIFLEQIFDQDKTDFMQVIQIVKQGLKQKEIQMYFNNQYLQEKIQEYDWAGQIKNTSKDYLAVVNSNIAGGKTDHKIQQTIQHTSEIQADGSIIDTLTITRQHTGQTTDLFANVRNVNFMRVYVPQGSVLLEAQGFEKPELSLFDLPEKYLELDEDLLNLEQNKKIHQASETFIYDTHQKTIFGNWTQTDPGQSSTITLKYKLPYKIEINQPTWWQDFTGQDHQQKFYSIFYQIQSGSDNTKVESKIILPKYLNAVWQYPQNNNLGNNNVITHNFDFNSDNLNSIIIEIK